jgi:BirA family biotin operon repressor/biotin-[acetyl-CoA-carboxylase] ligase
MKPLSIGEQLIWLEEVNSTNSYLAIMARKGVSEGVVVAARYQSDGKGQRGNSWESEVGKNLTFSVLLHPTFLPVKDQFLLSKLTALAVCDTLQVLASDISIKWPNDIYVGDCKICGILIENSFSSNLMDTTIIGIGLNVNQKTFPDDIPNPTSLSIIVKKHFSINDILTALCSNLTKRYQQLKLRQWDILAKEYFDKLYRKDNYYIYKANDVSFKAKIVGVRDSGELMLRTESGEIREFAFKEVSFSGG